MPKRIKYPEETIQKALKKATEQKKAGKSVNVSALAREFQIGRLVLRGRLNGKTSYTNRSPFVQATKLDQLQEKALLAWIHQLDEWGAPPTPTEIEACANSILRRNALDITQPPHVSKNWKYNFIKRHTLPLIDQKPVKDDRLRAEDLGHIQHWFQLLQEQIQEHGIEARNIYNFDESGFRLGEGKRQKVVSFRPGAKRGSPSTESGESVTDIECIAADGFVLPPYFILKGENHLERWYENRIPDDYRINISKSGWSNDLIAFDWIQHFHRYTSHRAEKGKRLLLMDNHTSHLTYEFIQFCEGVDIILVPFPPHTTHFLQPLDGKPFLALKHYFRQTNTKISRWGFDAAEKASFLTEMPQIRQNAFKSRTIRHAFKERGLWPWDPEQILPTLRQQVDQEAEELQIFNGSPPTSSITATPRVSPPNTIRTVRRTQQKIINTPEAQLSSRKYQRRVRQATESLIKAVEEIEAYKASVSATQRQQTKKSRRQVKTGLSQTGALYVSEANRHIEARGQKEREAVIRKAQRDWQRENQQENQQEPSPIPEQPTSTEDLGFYIDLHPEF